MKMSPNVHTGHKEPVFHHKLHEPFDKSTGLLGFFMDALFFRIYISNEKVNRKSMNVY